MKKILWIGFLVLLAFLVACNDDTETSTDSSDSNNTDSSSNNDNSNSNNDDGGDLKTLTIANGADMVTFDIHDHSNTSTEAIHTNMFSYLVKNNGGVFDPDLATEWELVEDEIWEFKLREGVTFHNGEDLTAEDVKFTLERVATDSALSEHQNYRQIKEVEVIDDHTFRIHTDGPQPVLLNRLSRLGSGILPKDYIEENGMDHFLSEPVGSGPYQFVEWVRDDRVVLEVFEDYYDGKIADWDRVVFRSIPETSTRIAEALTGGVDIAVNIPPHEWDRVDNNDGTSIVKGPTNRVMMLVPNHREEFATSDLRVRQAIDYAIDDRAILDNLMGGAGTPTLTRVPPGNTGANEDLFDTYRYDVEKAKELLAEAGYEDGLEITIQSSSGRYLQDRDTTELIGGMLGEVGITANIEFMEWSNFVEVRNANNQKELYLIGLSGSLWDATHQLRHHHSAVSEPHIGYKNEEFDEIYLDAEINMNPEERAQQYMRLQEIADEDLVNTTLFQLDNFYAVSDQIDFSPRIDEMWRIEDIKLK